MGKAAAIDEHRTEVACLLTVGIRDSVGADGEIDRVVTVGHDSPGGIARHRGEAPAVTGCADTDIDTESLGEGDCLAGCSVTLVGRNADSYASRGSGNKRGHPGCRECRCRCTDLKILSRISEPKFALATGNGREDSCRLGRARPVGLAEKVR